MGWRTRLDADPVRDLRARRRRAEHVPGSGVARAWWRALAAERAFAGIDALEAEALAVLKGPSGAPGGVAAVTWRQEVLEIAHALEDWRREAMPAGFELAGLAGLPPGAVPVPGPELAPPGLAADPAAQDALACAVAAGCAGGDEGPVAEGPHLDAPRHGRGAGPRLRARR